MVRVVRKKQRLSQMGETEVEPDETEPQVEVGSSSRHLLREVKDLYFLYGTYLAGYSSSYI